MTARLYRENVSEIAAACILFIKNSFVRHHIPCFRDLKLKLLSGPHED